MRRESRGTSIAPIFRAIHMLTGVVKNATANAIANTNSRSEKYKSISSMLCSSGLSQPRVYRSGAAFLLRFLQQNDALAGFL